MVRCLLFAETFCFVTFVLFSHITVCAMGLSDPGHRYIYIYITFIQLKNYQISASYCFCIQLPVWTPPVPRELTNDDGVILDLAPGGNKDVGTLDEVTSDALTVTTDPATIALQQVCLSTKQQTFSSEGIFTNNNLSKSYEALPVGITALLNK